MGEGSGKICLDTDIIIDYLKETKETENLMKKLYNKFDEVVLTTVTIYELLVGVEYLGGKDLDIASCGNSKKEAIEGLKNAIEAYLEFMISEDRENEIYRPVPMDEIIIWKYEP